MSEKQPVFAKNGCTLDEVWVTAAIPQSLIKDNRLRLVFVGGAAGVGKTTILEGIPEVHPINTGSFFKELMALDSRDDVRKGDWSAYESAVANELLASVIKLFTSNNCVVIDTHFAAKIYNRQYRNGLKRDLICTLGKNIFSYGEHAGKTVAAIVILIDCDPHALLHRRRTDKTRNRQLIPSDCFNDLRENKILSRHYFSELLRAKSQVDRSGNDTVEYFVIQNDHIQAAIDMARRIILD